jgi:hypothetical protein
MRSSTFALSKNTWPADCAGGASPNSPGCMSIAFRISNRSTQLNVRRLTTCDGSNAVVVLGDEAAEPGLPLRLNRVPAAEGDLQERLDLPVVRAAGVVRVEDTVGVVDLDGRAGAVGAVELVLPAAVDRVRRDEAVCVVEARPGGVRLEGGVVERECRRCGS